MKIALDWLAQYLSPAAGLSPQAVADAYMNAGLPVETITEAQGVEGPTHILDVEVTSNRTDCLCHAGLARELAALTARSLKMPPVTLTESPTAAADQTRVEINDLEGCPYYSARIIRNVKVGPSPAWLVRRLESIGLRPVNNIVDITNFVLMELGQPLHAFDFDRLHEKRIIVRRAAQGEKMMAIDGRECALDPSMLVIADANSPVAIAGVMGGKHSEVTTATTTVLLESARFEPLTIRTTSRTLALKSDSSYRFERGIDPAMAELASRRAAQLMVEIAGGELFRGVVSAGEAKAKLPTVTMRMKRFREVIGVPIAPDRALGILAALGFSPSIDERTTAADDDLLMVRVPSHRLDVDREIDLIEEISRVHGFSHVPTLNQVTHPVKPEPVRERAMRVLRAAMVEAGFSEAVTVTFIAEAEAAPFVREGSTLIHPQHGGWKADVLRPSVLPSLLAARRTNQYAGVISGEGGDVRLFETAATFEQRGEARSQTPTERRMLTALAGDLSPLTGLLPLLVDRLNPDAELRVTPQDAGIFVRGAAGEVVLQAAGKSQTIGRIGLLVPDLQKKYDLRHAVAGMEIELEPLLAIYQPVRRAKPVPRYPGVKRDLSVVVEEGVRWADVNAAIAGRGIAMLEHIAFVTTFRHASVGADKKSLTLTLEFRDPGRTLKSEEVDTQVATVLAILKEQFSAALRA